MVDTAHMIFDPGVWLQLNMMTGLLFFSVAFVIEQRLEPWVVQPVRQLFNPHKHTRFRRVKRYCTMHHHGLCKAVSCRFVCTPTQAQVQKIVYAMLLLRYRDLQKTLHRVSRLPIPDSISTNSNNSGTDKFHDYQLWKMMHDSAPTVVTKRLAANLQHIPLDGQSMIMAAAAADNPPIVINTGASVSLTSNLKDFVQPLKTSTINMLQGLQGGASVVGEGMVKWNIQDARGLSRKVRTKAYYVPQATMRLLSPQSLFQEKGLGWMKTTKTGLEMSVNNHHVMEFTYHKGYNLPMA
jgi:hypothetical protein